MKKSRYFAVALAAVTGLSIVAGAPAAHAAVPPTQLSYEDGASNEYSFRMM